LIWVYLMQHAEELGSVSSQQMLQGSIPRLGTGPVLSKIPRWSIGLVGYAAGTLVAFVSAGASLAVYGLLAVFYLFNHLPNPPRDVPTPDV
jgi:hypothetical protein